MPSFLDRLFRRPGKAPISTISAPEPALGAHGIEAVFRQALQLWLLGGKSFSDDTLGGARTRTFATVSSQSIS